MRKLYKKNLLKAFSKNWNLLPEKQNIQEKKTSPPSKKKKSVKKKNQSIKVKKTQKGGVSTGPLH